ncbi:MAG: PEP-CTERM sorting domain-containing protein [Planctomycetota bacterium]
MLRSTVLSAVMAAGVAGTSMAQPAFWDFLNDDVVAYDPFLQAASGPARGLGEYTTGGNIAGQGAAAFGWVGTSGVDGFGIGHAGSTSNFSANAGGEDSALVDYEQGGRLEWGGVGPFPFDRNLRRTLNPTPSSSEWYMSIMVNRLGWADSTSNTWAVGGFTDATNSGIQIGYDDQLNNDFTPDLVARIGGQNFQIIADAPSSTSFYAIAKLTLNTSGNDLVEVWVNQDPNALGAPDLSVNSVNVSDSLTPFTQSRYESPGQSGVTFFDEVLLATSLDGIANPVPEPASLALLAAAGLATLGRRRKA